MGQGNLKLDTVLPEPCKWHRRPDARSRRMRSLPPGLAPAKDQGWTSQHPRDIAQILAKSHAITSHEPKSSASCRERHHCMRPHGHNPNPKGTRSPVSRACSYACRGLAAAALKCAAQASLSPSSPPTFIRGQRCPCPCSLQSWGCRQVCAQGGQGPGQHGW